MSQSRPSSVDTGGHAQSASAASDHHIEAILGAVDFIEGRLERAVTIGQIAEAVHYSLYHFARTFNRVTHHTPYDYLMRRRISASAMRLLTTGRRIIDIAYDFQFANPETYTRAFRRLFGMPPSRARAAGRLPVRASMPRLTRDHLAHRTSLPAPRAAVVDFEAVPLVGLATLLKADEASSLGQLWAAVNTLTQAEAPGSATRYTVVRRGPLAGRRTSWAIAGCAAERTTFDALDAVLATAPAGPYARLEGSICEQQLPFALDYLYHTWMPRAGVQPAGGVEIIVHASQDWHAVHAVMARVGATQRRVKRQPKPV